MLKTLIKFIMTYYNNWFTVFLIITTTILYSDIELVNGLPAFNDDDLFTTVKRNCIALNNENNTNALMDEKFVYDSLNCKGVTLQNEPEPLHTRNLKDYLCIGVINAELHLCHILTNISPNINYSTVLLPKSVKELNEQIGFVQKQNSSEICNGLKSVFVTNLFDDFTTKWTKLLYDYLLDEEKCKNICRDVVNENSTNALCATIYYVNLHMKNLVNITQAQQHIEKTVTPIETEAPTTMKKTSVMSQQSVTTAKKTNAQNSTVAVEITSSTKEQVTTSNGIVTEKSIVQNTQKSLTDKQSQVLSTDSKKHSIIPNVPVQEENKNKITPDKDTIKNDVSEVENPQNQQIADNNKVPADKTPDKNLPSILTDDLIETDNANDDLKENYYPDSPVETVDKKSKNNNNNILHIQSGLPDEDFEDVDDSNFFSYFMFISVLFIAGYVVYHNKQKIFAIVVEGRRERGGSRRRPNTASYRKLNSNLEEVMTSKCSDTSTTSHVIY